MDSPKKPKEKAATLGRPTQQEAARRQRFLLETAMALFLEHGLSVSMDMIAAKASISKRTLYARYPDKLALFVAVLKWLSSEQSDIDFHLPQDMPLADALMRHAEMLFHHYSAPHIVAYLQLMQREKAHVPDLERLMRQEVMRDQILPLAEYLAQRSADGAAAFDPLVAAKIHVRNIIGDITDAYADGRVPDFAASHNGIAQAVKILIHGLSQDGA
jgi:AcrR family transcriptional regulator